VSGVSDSVDFNADDEVLVEGLRQRARVFGRVPPDVTRDALAAFAMANLDEELATLLRDSADEENVVGVRTVGVSDIRLLAFGVGSGELHLGLSTGQIKGTVVGRTERTIHLVTMKQRHVLDVDAFGDFSASNFGSGPIRFELGTGPSKVVTDWILPPRA
jgi:hypothetical protein